ncbi:holo-ACP synthase [Actinomyces slackii]|uniref:holo-ACP synthase AcpS n=1 Tax=Actinomyces slackii TaxID=52774 RepID=UPI000684AD2D|nr:holo-ACP synthase [Actinomyces slackii]
MVGAHPSSPPPAAAPPLPPLPALPAGSGVLGVGIDLVHIPDLAHQLTIPGTVFGERAFTARELRDAARRAEVSGSTRAEHLAGRWAAKEAFIKAWSAAANTRSGRAVAPHLPPETVDWRDIELVGDRWGRPSLHLTGTVAAAISTSLGKGAVTAAHWPVSISHDGDWAVAIVLCTTH